MFAPGGTFQAVYTVVMLCMIFVIPVVGLFIAPLLFIALLTSDIGVFSQGCRRCGYIAVTRLEEYQRLRQSPGYSPPHRLNRGTITRPNGSIKPWT